MESAPTVPATDDGRDEPPFPPALLEELLRQLDKTVRARQLYLANNPSYLRTLDTLRASFAPVWKAVGSFTLQVTDTQFRWMGHVVHEQTEKASDSMPWLLYKDGLREITLSHGFETEEIQHLIDIIPQVRRAAADQDDLITLLWEQEFAFLSYRYVELGQDGSAPLNASAEPGRYVPPAGTAAESPTEASASARAEAEAQAESTTERKGIVKLDEFDSTLYFLDDKEVQYVKREVAREYSGDLRRTALDALLDILELQTDARVRGEVLQLLDQLTLHLLSAGRFQAVAYLLRESVTLTERARELDPAHRDRLRALPGRLSDPATLSQILQQLDEATQFPSQEDLSALFAELNATALETVFEWLSRVQNAQVRALLESAAERLASANTTELVRLITQSHGAAAIEAVRRAGALKTAAAVGPLAKTLSEPNRDLRLAAVSALVEIGSAGAMQTLERALADTDRDIRVTAVRALGNRSHRAALPRIETIIKSKELRTADLSERMAFFEAFGALGGDGGVPFLDNILNGKSGMFGRREDPELRACAAVALGRTNTPRAQQALQKALAEKDVVVRTAVNRALRGGAA